MNRTVLRKKSLIGFKTFSTLFAFSFDQILDPNKGILAQYAYREEFASASWCFLGIGLFLLYRYSERSEKAQSLQKSELICSLFFAVSMLVGRSFSQFGSWDLILGNLRQFLCALFALTGWSCLFYTLLVLLTARLLSCGQAHNNSKWDFSKEAYLPHKIFLVIIIGWLPYLMATWPGSVPHDSMWQLSMWLGYEPLNNHHPWLTTMIFGVLMQIGRTVSDNTGVFLIILFQMILCASAFTFICLRVRRYGGSSLCTALYFSLVPLWGCFVTSVLKDMLFIAVYGVYFCYFTDLFQAELEERSFRKFDWIVFFLLNLLICMIRSDGIYRILPSGLVLCIALKRYRKQLIFCTLICCFLFQAYNNLSFRVIGIAEGSKKEMLSIPFQQTARYVRDLPDDVTEEEKAAIDRVLPYDQLGESYNGELADPVKNRAKAINMGDFKGYLTAWLSMGLRHPEVYIQATLNNTYSYFYPFHNCRVMSAYQNYIKGEPINPGLKIYYVNQAAHDSILEYAELWRVFPALSLLSNPASYTWLLAIALMYMIKKRYWKDLAVFIVPMIHLAICVASPVNGLLRYALPLMVCMPILLVWM